jgi:rSAM/selenodomain-associated transferase 1
MVYNEGAGRTVKPWLVLMMKAPRAGEVKTRLAAELGEERALKIYQRLVEHVVSSVFRDGAKWRAVIAYTPESEGDAVRAWLAPILPADTLFIPQASGDLGEKLYDVFLRGFQGGASSVLAIGADCPEIAPGDIEAALASLSSSRVVMGPTLDGGYWIIGMRSLFTQLFEGMPWSTPDLADATRRRAAELNLTLAEAATKRDIDKADDMATLPEEIRALL